MTDPVGVAEAKRRFSELLDRVAGGEHIVVARRGRPAVEKRGSTALAARVQELIASAGVILAFDQHAGRRYGELRAELARAGRRIAEPDLRIAAIALTRDATLVTANVKHFARIGGLRVENWLVDAG